MQIISVQLKPRFELWVLIFLQVMSGLHILLLGIPWKTCSCEVVLYSIVMSAVFVMVSDMHSICMSLFCV